ncbi:helix-turn-helix transcriptional regulator [Pseudokordiimonas caeni]|uniref:helix-turn-helix transcriptional regulator n=1 Tax=Pseudokordiimonas caeni TaxID=2997908 RepID=UPI002810ABDB|nr:LuxR C-terminal-related transcriptional regulator [Pseudokordiimonas caeni]
MDKGPNIPEWLVGAKVQPPRQGRDELFRLPTEEDEAPAFITYVEAPAGYGKTTFLTQYRQRWLARSDSKVLWLTFSRDESARSLVEYLAFALLRQDVSLAHDFYEGVAENTQLTRYLNIIANTLEHDGSDWLVVFDDLEVIGREVLEAVEYLISIAPQNVNFLIAGRTNPGLALTRYAAQMQLDQVRAEDLCFTAQHILALFGQKISLDDAIRIEEATLGWPIAVKLVQMDIKSGCSLDEALRRLGDSSATAAHYIKEQIETRLPADMRIMLLEAAVLEWLEADALRATQGSDNLLTRLGELGEIGSLISMIDDGSETFRLHPLLRDHLGETLKREAPEKYRDLHRRAARWMADRNRLRLALSHAYLSDDRHLVGTLIEEFGAVRLFFREGVTRAYSFQVYLSDPILESFPRVALMYCVAQTKLGALRDARRVYHRVSGLTAGFTKDRDSGDDVALDLDHRFCRVFLALYGCLAGSDLRQEDLDRMPERMGTSAVVDGAFNNTLCVSNFVRGQLDEAARRASHARASYEDASSLYGQLYIDLHEGAIAFNRGDLDAATRHFEAGKARYRRYFREDEGARLACDVMQAELALYAGDMDRAARLLPSFKRRLVAFEAWRDIYAMGITAAVDHFLAEDRLADARDLLKELRHYFEEEQVADMLPIVGRLEMVLRAANGEAIGTTLGSGYLPTPEVLLENLADLGWRDSENIVRTHYLCQRYQRRDLKLGDIAEAVATYFLKLGLNVPACRVLVTAAASEHATGKPEAAFRLLALALPTLRATGGAGLARLEAAAIRGILDDAAGPIGTDTDDVWITELVRQESAPDGPLFSPRESDVLRHLVEGKQDKVIARELGVTEHAVRYHLKNIYAKMQVSGRHEAVARLGKLRPVAG